MNHWRAFDKRFFIRHQDTILFVLNAPILSVLFRRIFRICAKGTIAGILPNAYFTTDGVTVTADFRTHWKYSKRLYYAFRPLWWMFHAWDWCVADRWMPELSFGFATLTVFPDADPEVSTVDGHVERTNASGESWATIIAGAGTLANSVETSGSYIKIVSYPSADNWQTLRRSILLFDTSGLTSSATISAAVLSIYGLSKQDAAGIIPNVDIYTSTPASNTDLVAADYGQTGATSQTGSPITYDNWSIVGYNDFTLNSIGRGNVSLTGVSKFSVRNANYDVAGVSPTWADPIDSRLVGYRADQSGTTNDPKLVVTYTLSSTSAWVPSGRIVFESVGT